MNSLARQVYGHRANRLNYSGPDLDGHGRSYHCPARCGKSQVLTQLADAPTQPSKSERV